MQLFYLKKKTKQTNNNNHNKNKIWTKTKHAWDNTTINAVMQANLDLFQIV